MPNLKRISAVSFLLGLLFITAQQGLQAAAPYPPEIPEAQVEVYKVADGFELKVWILNPLGHRVEKPVPGAVFFFGGGWNNGTPGQFLKQAEHLTARGMVVVLADYRVKSRQGVQPESCVSDAKSAMRWVRSNAARLGIDPDRILAGGGSAGGHLAAATAFLPGLDDPSDDLSVSPRPSALALFNPALVLAPVPGKVEMSPERLKSLEARMGVPPTDLSPFHHLDAGAPPCIIFHGTADTTVPFLTVSVFRDQSVSMGNRCELVAYQGEPHGFFNYRPNHSATFFDTMHRLDVFLVSLGYIEGPPDVEHLK